MGGQMRKRKLFGVLLLVVALFSLAACSQTEEETPLSPQQNTLPALNNPSEPSTGPTPEPTSPEQQEAASPIGTEDTYWIAYEWYSESDEGAEGPFSMEPDEWMVDIIVRADGTARFRDIHDGIYLMDDADLDMTWEQMEDGEILFYNSHYLESVYEAEWKEDTITFDYRGIILTMEQADLPQGAGEQYHPAELVGTWLMVSGETEGWEWNAMPGRLESLVFKTASTAETVSLVADHENREYYGELRDSRYGQELIILNEPLYEGCGNEVWSVRIGPESPVDENGYLVETEFYVTMLERDTMLMQRYYTLDGYPAVSYQTFRRMPGSLTWWDVQIQELEDTSWVCTGYLTADGTELPMPPYLKDFYLYFEANAECGVGRMNKDSDYYTDTQGSWLLGNGGVLLLQSEGYDSPDGYCPEFWYGGVVSGYTYETEDGFTEGYELYLHDGEGTLKLTLQGYG